MLYLVLYGILEEFTTPHPSAFTPVIAVPSFSPSLHHPQINVPNRRWGHRAAVGEGRPAGVHLCLSSLSATACRLPHPTLHPLSTPSPPPLTPLLAPCSDQRPDRPRRHRAAVGEGRPARVHLCLSSLSPPSPPPPPLHPLSPLLAPCSDQRPDRPRGHRAAVGEGRPAGVHLCLSSLSPPSPPLHPLSTPSTPPLTPLLAPCSDQCPDRPRGHRAAVGEGRPAGVHLCLSSLSRPSPPLHPLSTPSHPSPRPLLRSTSRPTSRAPSCCRRRSTGASSSLSVIAVASLAPSTPSPPPLHPLSTPSTPSPPPLTPLLAPCSDQRPDRPRGHRAAVGEGRPAGVHRPAQADADAGPGAARQPGRGARPRLHDARPPRRLHALLHVSPRRDDDATAHFDSCLLLRPLGLSPPSVPP